MRLILCATVVAVASVCALPLLLVMVPRAVFRVYLHYIPIGVDHPHVQESLVSISEITAAVLCLVPPYISMDIVCPTSGEAAPQDAPPFELFLLNQQTIFETSAYYGPTPHSVASLSLLAHAAHSGPILRSVITLLDSDNEAVHGDMGEMGTLKEIVDLSMATAKAYYRFLVHLELAVCRAVFVQNTVSVALSLLEQLALSDRYIRDGVPLPTLDRVADITSMSMANSLKYIYEELRTSISTSHALLFAIERVKMDASRLLHRCTHPGSTACAQAHAIILHEGLLRTAIEDMSMLIDVLDKEITGGAHARSGYPFLLILLPTIQVHEAALNTLLLFVQNARQAAAATVKAGKVFPDVAEAYLG